MIVLTQWILGVFLGIVLLKVLVLWLEPRLAFYPSPGPTPPPPSFETFEVVCSDGVRITGWHNSPSDSGPVFLYFCGNAGNLGDRSWHLSAMNQAGAQLIAFNYRGTGTSTGSPSEEGLYRDAEAVYSFLRTDLHVPAERIVLWGHSIGGAVAAHLATEQPCSGLVLEATFRSARLMAGRMLPFLPVGPLMSYRFDNERNVELLQVPVLFVHGTADTIIPFADSEHLYSLAPEAKEFWPVDGADHNDIQEVAGSAFAERLIAFASQAVSDPHIP